MNTIIQTIFAGMPQQSLELLAPAAPEFGQAICDLSEDLAALTPEPRLILRAFRECPRPRAVLLGQDPYPRGADGLSFSSAEIRPSLKAILACLQRAGLMGDAPYVGSLAEWSQNGVLLLNTALTTRAGESNVHAKAWAPFTAKIISVLAARPDPPAFILLGNHAKAYERAISSAGGRYFSWGHPSPMNAANHSGGPDAFVNCTSFRQVNEYLAESGREPIPWGIIGDKPAPAPALDCGFGGVSILPPASPAALAPPKPQPKSYYSPLLSPAEIEAITKSSNVWIFTDGGAPKNGQANCPAAWGVHVKSHEGVIAERSCLLAAPGSNNRAELHAMIVGFLFAEQALILNPRLRVSLGYDSKYAAGALTIWGSGVTSAGGVRKNVDMIEPAQAWIKPLVGRVSLVHIHSHTKRPSDPAEAFLWDGNDRADRLCTELLQ